MGTQLSLATLSEYSIEKPWTVAEKLLTSLTGQHTSSHVSVYECEASCFKLKKRWH